MFKSLVPASGVKSPAPTIVFKTTSSWVVTPSPVSADFVKNSSTNGSPSYCVRTCCFPAFIKAFVVWFNCKNPPLLSVYLNALS